MKDGYCPNCPNPIECYQTGKCWPSHALTNPDSGSAGMTDEENHAWLESLWDDAEAKSKAAIALASESHCEAAGTADEKPDGQAENDLVEARLNGAPPSQSSSAALPPMAGSASPRTRFSHPIQTTTGQWSALWMGDKITVERRSGSRALCRVEWGENIQGKPHSIRAWLPKRQLRFSRQNANVDLPDTAAQDSASKPNNPAVSG